MEDIVPLIGHLQLVDKKTSERGGGGDSPQHVHQLTYNGPVLHVNVHVAAMCGKCHMLAAVSRCMFEVFQ